MSGVQDNGGRGRVSQDRYGVCDVVIIDRPVSSRRRCADHLNQLVLVPLSAIHNNQSKTERRDGR